MDDIIKIKDVLPKLLNKKITEIHNIVTNKEKKIKLKINLTTKSLSRKQVIILISTNSLEAIIPQANKHVVNINCLLKDAKSEILANFIYSNNKGVIITTNKAAVASDLIIMEKYVKGVDKISQKTLLAFMPEL